MLGFDLIEVMPLLIRVIAMMGIFVVIAIYVFPKRRLRQCDSLSNAVEEVN